MRTSAPVVADEPVGDAVPNRVDVHERVISDAALQAAPVGRKRPRRERSQRLALLALESIRGALMGRAVDAMVSREQPLRKVRLEVRERIETAAGDGVALHVLHAGLGLALGASPVWLAGPGLDAPVAAERDVRG